MAKETDLERAAGDWDGLHRRPPSTLYHYTTAQGLLGLLTERHLWATNARFMNDPSEIQYSVRLIEETLADAAGKHAGQIEQLAEGFIDRVRTKLREQHYSVPKLEEWTRNAIGVFEEQGGAYIACFCKEPDLLSQWRGYGAVGGGYAVGFAARELARPSAGLLLRRVIYDRPEQESILRRWTAGVFALDLAWRREQKEALSRLKPDIATWQQLLDAWKGDAERERQLRELAEQGLARLNEGMERFSRFLAECLICFKDPAYSEEKEWRLIQFGSSNPPIKYRVGRGCLLPYVDLDLTSSAPKFKGRLPLRQITYGPVLESSLVERSLKTALTTHGYTDVVNRVARSRVPYRG